MKIKTPHQTIVRILKERGESLLNDHAVDPKAATEITDQILAAIKPKVVIEVSPRCERCGKTYPAAGDGWDGKCADCADRSAMSAGRSEER